MTTGSGWHVPGGPPTPGGDPAVTTDRTARIDALAAYFRANAAGYTTEALRKAALDAGYEPREIDAAWAVTAEPVPPRGRASLVPGLITIAYIVGTYALVFVLAAMEETNWLAVPALGLSLVVGILVWLSLRESRPDLANAFKIGVILAIVLPLVLALVALGICVVALVGYGR